tara:strand:+ start:1509 stop:2126 length:618 start_codon:yes stop_codon:yes gene_type:complete
MSPDELDEKWEREQGEHEARGIRGKVAKDVGRFADKRAKGSCKGYERLDEIKLKANLASATLAACVACVHHLHRLLHTRHRHHSAPAPHAPFPRGDSQVHRPYFGRRSLRTDADADADADAEMTEAKGGDTAEEKAAAAIQARIRGRLSRRQAGAPQSQCTRSTDAVRAAAPSLLSRPSSPRASLRSLKLPKILNFRILSPSPRR